jgi:hypothetical protein
MGELTSSPQIKGVLAESVLVVALPYHHQHSA